MASSSSAFSRAVHEFVSRPSKKKTPAFIQHALQLEGKATADEVQDLMLKLEADSSQHRISRKVLRPICDVLLGFDGIINALAQTDPMPSALIWGGLKAVLDCCRRYTSLLEKVEGQMKRLGRELKRMKEYEDLFRDSSDLQQLLTQSYLGVIKFWVRVESQCKTCGFILAAKSLTSFATTKLDDILSDIAENGNDIAKLVPIVQERVRRGEQEDAAAEFRKAGMVLAEILGGQKEEREARHRTSAARQKKEVRQWISGGAQLNVSNNQHQYHRANMLLAGTGAWLRKDPHFNHWRDLSSGSNVLWLHGSFGVGKSVTCAHAVRQLRELHPLSAIAFQYFSFDESDRLLMLYRNIADQLFHHLYDDSDDEMSDEIYKMAQRPATVEAMKHLIKVLVAEMESTYLLFDGLDEEYSNSERWQIASDIVTFFLDLAKQENSSLKVWCSSQDRRKVRDLMAGAEQIQLTAATNNQDIEMLFAATLQSRDFTEFDADIKMIVLSSLRRQVNGNFLWARLMLDTICKAVSVKDLLATLDRLPEGFDDYLGRKIRSFTTNKHCFLSQVFSCLVYAKRPMLLEELWEVIDIADLPANQDLCSPEFLRRNFLDSCAPLVLIKEVPAGKVNKQVCALSHASIRGFLDKNPAIFSSEDGCRITPSLLAHACRKYLQQPRYGRLLVKGSGTFMTACGKDILEQPFLTYSAKYWHRHLDDLPYSVELCSAVDEFIRSPHYITTIQVQSILVGGQFAFWGRAGDPDSALHLVRVLPRWFMENPKSGGNSLHCQYHHAIGEFGYYLDTISAIGGPYPGQLQRCWWPSLGKSNFLHSVPSDFKSFVFEKSDTKHAGRSGHFVEQLSANGTELRLFKLDSCPDDDGKRQVACERWSISRGSRPKLAMSSKLAVPLGDLKIYGSRLKDKSSSPAPPMAVSEDGSVLRLGSQIYLADDAFQFRPVGLPEGRMEFVEDVTYNGRFIAIASRDHITEKDVEEALPDKPAEDAIKPPEDSPTSGSESDSDSNSDEDRGSKRRNSSASKTSEEDSVRHGSDAASKAGSDDSLELESEAELRADKKYESDDFASQSDSIGTNSARESWSDGSTPVLSDEIEDEFIWDDFDKESEEPEVEDSEDSEDEDSKRAVAADISDAESNQSEDSLGSRDSSLMPPTEEDGSSFNRGSDAGSEATYSDEGSYEPSDSDEDSEHDSYPGGRLALEEHFGAEAWKNSDLAKTCELRILRAGGPGQAEQVFRYVRKAAWPIHASPPVFHPTRDLAVWPLGGNEILFAHFTDKTYFSRIINNRHTATCEISVQCRFSSCGQYLHVAALHGYVDVTGSGDGPVMGLRMHMSAYRLSRQKLERSPPRLVHRSAFNLNMMYSQDDKLRVSLLPVTLTWTDACLYISKSARMLKVLRVPLYAGRSLSRQRRRRVPAAVVAVAQGLLRASRQRPRARCHGTGRRVSGQGEAAQGQQVQGGGVRRDGGARRGEPGRGRARDDAAAGRAPDGAAAGRVGGCRSDPQGGRTSRLRGAAQGRDVEGWPAAGPVREVRYERGLRHCAVSGWVAVGSTAFDRGARDILHIMGLPGI